MVDPSMPTEPVAPPYARHGGLIAWLAAEVWDHLWPWSPHDYRNSRALQAAGIALALAATLAWILAAMGELRAGGLIGWWFGWSVFEVMVRLRSKPYVKEGTWWGRRYRRATPMDMICYVGFKNLLIGAVLFLTLKSFGLLSV